MRLWAVLIGLLLITPFLTNAAGFAKESLFLSKPATEGEVVFIHTVVTNPADAAFAGDVVFKHGDTKVGTVAVTLPAGGAEAVSVSWQPLAGEHTITAELTTKDGVVAASESATFTVKAKPVEAGAAMTTPASVESSAKIKEAIANISPQAADVAAPVFATLDGLRQKGVEALVRGETWAKAKTEKPAGEVAGADKDTGGGLTGTVLSLVATLLLYLFAALKYVVSNAGIFYPVLALLFFYMLWKLFKRMRRPRSS